MYTIDLAKMWKNCTLTRTYGRGHPGVDISHIPQGARPLAGWLAGLMYGWIDVYTVRFTNHPNLHKSKAETVSITLIKKTQRNRLRKKTR